MKSEVNRRSGRIVLISLAVLVAALVSAFIYGLVNWESTTQKLRRRLEASPAGFSAAFFDTSETDTLPAPVRGFFRKVLRQGAPMVSRAEISHSGTFNMSEDGVDWKPFTSNQAVVTGPPGFVWDARIRLGLMMVVFVHDAYMEGEGLLSARFAGIFTVADQPSSPELAQGELMRYLAEALWYPTALLPGQGVAWETMGEDEARATIADGSNEVSLVFRFTADSLISSVRSEGRYREVGGVQKKVPWEGRFARYERRGGMLVPIEGEAGWLLPDGYMPYWRGSIESIEYETAEKGD